MYLLLAIGFSSKGFRNFSSKSVANKIAYGGANIVPNGVSRISLKSFSSNFKMLFFSTTSASSIIMSPEFSLLSFHYGIDEKVVWDFLMHVLILELFICFLQIIFSMSQTTTANSLSGPFSMMLGLSSKLCNRLCFPWIWLFYLLEEISMFNNLSFKQLRYYWDTDSILVPCIKWRFMYKFVCHKRLSIISKVPDKLKFSSVFF